MGYLFVLAGVPLVSAGAGAGNSGFFEINAHDPNVLLAAMCAVGFLQWLKWVSDLRSRRKNPWKVVGDIGLAMSLIWGWAALLVLFEQIKTSFLAVGLNMPWLVLGVLCCGFIGRDLFDREAQTEVKTGVRKVIRSLAGVLRSALDALIGVPKEGDGT